MTWPNPGSGIVGAGLNTVPIVWATLYKRGLRDLVIRHPEGARWPSKRALPAAERSRRCAIADATARAPEDGFRAACGDRRDRGAGLADVETCLCRLR